MKNIITIKSNIIIQASKKDVWNYTQDFGKRRLWDKAILRIEILRRKPFKLVRLKTIGFLVTELKYKLCKKYEKTSLKMINTKSLIVKGGGGSWNYETVEEGTLWTQTNSLILKNRMLYLIFGGVMKLQLKYLTKQSMRTAKELIEK